MTTLKWQPGKLYLPGELVQPASQPPVVAEVIPNAGFESGDTAWTKNGISIVNEAGSFSGGWHAKSIYAGGVATSIAMTGSATVVPGQRITASCMMRAFGGDDQVGGQFRIVWLNSAGGVVSAPGGNQINVINGQAWKQSSVTAVAPAGASAVRLQGDAFNLRASGVVLFDAFTWNYTAPPSTAGLIYRAVQAAAGTSGSGEPAWPTTLGVTVIDNQVIWEAVQTSRVVWTAVPALLTGSVEPDWPTQLGAFVDDGTVQWEVVSRRVEDVNCPNSKIVVIAASKVYAADDDIMRYSATVNPLDWSSEDDAGYLPVNLHNFGANPIAAANLYRSNLVVFNAQGFQMWQVDEDPANSALLDALPIGSTQHDALTPVSNDLLFLSSQGVRSVGISAGSNNLAAGDVGMPIDPLTQAAMIESAATGNRPISLYYPAAGQYWLAFPVDILQIPQ